MNRNKRYFEIFGKYTRSLDSYFQYIYFDKLIHFDNFFYYFVSFSYRTLKINEILFNYLIEKCNIHYYKASKTIKIYKN